MNLWSRRLRERRATSHTAAWRKLISHFAKTMHDLRAVGDGPRLRFRSLRMEQEQEEKKKEE